MSKRIEAASAWPAARTTLTAAAILAVVGSSPALAQRKQAPKPTTPAPTAQQQPDLFFSPWTKFCIKGQEPKAKQICFTGKDAHLNSGAPAAAAALVETENDRKKVLRVTLPLGVQLGPGTRFVIDNSRPTQGHYVICYINGCMAEYDATTQVINQLKEGKQLAIQAVNANGQAFSVNLPLGDFAKVYAGPPVDTKVFEARQKKMLDELDRRVSEADQRLESLYAKESAKPK